MPMIDVYAPADLFPAGTDGLLGKELTMAVLRAEGVAAPGPFHLNNTAAFIHRMDPRSEEHTSELQSPCNLVCRLLLEKKKITDKHIDRHLSHSRALHIPQRASERRSPGHDPCRVCTHMQRVDSSHVLPRLSRQW